MESSVDRPGRSYSAFWGVFRSLGKVTLLSRPSSHPQPTNHTSDKKRKKSPKPSQKHIHLGIPINIAIAPLGFRAELDTDFKGN